MLILDPVLVTVKSNYSQWIPGKNPRDCTRSKNKHVRPDPNLPEVDVRLSFLSNSLWTPFTKRVWDRCFKQGARRHTADFGPAWPCLGEPWIMFVPKTKHKDSNHKAAHCASELNPDEAQAKIQSPQGQGRFFLLSILLLWACFRHQGQCKQT